MPHIVLEVSKNTSIESAAKELLLSIHNMLVATGAFKSKDIKSRLYVSEHCLVGDGSDQIGFAHMSVSILPGRELTLIKDTSEKLLSLLKTTLEKLHPEKLEQFALSVEFRELHKESYSKVVKQ
jgi:5-carboxymethyl-2-hydroxymuconate isomerase